VTTREKVEHLLRRLCAAQEELAAAQSNEQSTFSERHAKREKLQGVFDSAVHKLMALIGGR
jgi:hypothetical protein